MRKNEHILPNTSLICISHFPIQWWSRINWTMLILPSLECAVCCWSCAGALHYLLHSAAAQPSHTTHFTHTHTKKLHRPNSKHTLLSTYFSKLSPLWRWVKDGKSNAAYPQLELLLPKSKITFLSFNFWRWQLQSLIEISGDGQQILNVLVLYPISKTTWILHQFAAALAGLWQPNSSIPCDKEM